MSDPKPVSASLAAGMEHLHAAWGWFVALGVALVILGIVCILGEIETTLITVIVLGWLLLISGVIALVHAFRTRTWTGFFLYLLSAVLRVMTGYLLVRYPLIGALTLTCPGDALHRRWRISRGGCCVPALPAVGMDRGLRSHRRAAGRDAPEPIAGLEPVVPRPGSGHRPHLRGQRADGARHGAAAAARRILRWRRASAGRLAADGGTATTATPCRAAARRTHLRTPRERLIYHPGVGLGRPGSWRLCYVPVSGGSARALVRVLPSVARAAPVCMVLANAATSKVLKQDGQCEQRLTPASTFKIPLSLMGYDAGYLTDEHHPALPYRESYAASDPSWKTTVDPSGWITQSVVWYSQQLTLWLGKERLQRYVTRFNYGNHDLSGNPGMNDGLTQAWLDSSLQISPLEQIAFLEKTVNRQLGVSTRAYDMTARITEVGKLPHGWDVHGKGGTGFRLKPDHGGADLEHNLYSDLLLHHMGPGLADNISQGVAGGDEFRSGAVVGIRSADFLYARWRAFPTWCRRSRRTAATVIEPTEIRKRTAWSTATTGSRPETSRTC